MPSKPTRHHTQPTIRSPHSLLLSSAPGVDAGELYAVFNGKPLADSELLSLAGVEEEQTLYILGRLLGGGKKRKKKTYTKPKKQKHKHKKIKLRVLKFYKVRRWSTHSACRLSHSPR